MVAYGEDVAIPAFGFPELGHGFEVFMEIWEKVVVFLDEDDISVVSPKNPHSLEHEMQLPPPMVFGLGDGRFPVVSVRIWVFCVQTALFYGILLRYVSRTILRTLSWEFVGIQLDAVGEIDLEDLAKGNSFDHIGNFLWEIVMTEYHKCVLYSSNFFQGLYEHFEVRRTIVDLHDDDQLRIQWKLVSILNELSVVAVIDRLSHILNGPVLKFNHYSSLWDLFSVTSTFGSSLVHCMV